MRWETERGEATKRAVPDSRVLRDWWSNDASRPSPRGSCRDSLETFPSVSTFSLRLHPTDPPSRINATPEVSDAELDARWVSFAVEGDRNAKRSTQQPIYKPSSSAVKQGVGTV